MNLKKRVIKKETLRPTMQKFPWLLKPLSLIFFILSPIIFPLMVIFHNREMIVQLYDELFDMFFGKVK
ncbi:MAG TPA: hypothetical protein VLA13_07435 [Massilibacterium sp.]|nr:hypothetical protein [Massilibacterium sp.]